MGKLILFFFLICWLNASTFRYEYPLPQAQLQLHQKHGYALDGRRARRLLQSNSSLSSPLFTGLGTHYAFLWVGTPAQRVSVIVDTGSHHTAFPCTGCKCGKHMDPFFDPKQSSTSNVKTCGNAGQKCFFSQSYSEGSSWHAFKVSDKVWMGGPHLNEIPHAPRWSINFEFGCQDTETGLFRTQNVDGIMGMSAAQETLPFQLMKNGITTSKVFTMCFRVGGGILTLGGVDPSIHSPLSPSPTVGGVASALPNPVRFAKLTKGSGWFTVKLLDIFMRSPKDGSVKSIGGAIFKVNSGKGTIVDSGTTDTYLPSALAQNFKKLFEAIAGTKYVNVPVDMSDAQYSRLPSLIYRLEGLQEGSYVDIEVLPDAYVEQMKNKKRAARVYLTESVGAVLGANFMNHYNIIFDIENKRIGFAHSQCMYNAPSAGNGTAIETTLEAAENIAGAEKGKVRHKPFLELKHRHHHYRNMTRAAVIDQYIQRHLIAHMDICAQSVPVSTCSVACSGDVQGAPEVHYAAPNCDGSTKLSSAYVLRGTQQFQVPKCDPLLPVTFQPKTGDAKNVQYSDEARPCTAYCDVATRETVNLHALNHSALFVDHDSVMCDSSNSAWRKGSRGLVRHIVGFKVREQHELGYSEEEARRCMEAARSRNHSMGHLLLAEELCKRSLSVERSELMSPLSINASHTVVVQLKFNYDEKVALSHQQYLSLQRAFSDILQVPLHHVQVSSLGSVLDWKVVPKRLSRDVVVYAKVDAEEVLQWILTDASSNVSLSASSQSTPQSLPFLAENHSDPALKDLSLQSSLQAVRTAYLSYYLSHLAGHSLFLRYLATSCNQHSKESWFVPEKVMIARVSAVPDGKEVSSSVLLKFNILMLINDALGGAVLAPGVTMRDVLLGFTVLLCAIVSYQCMRQRLGARGIDGPLRRVQHKIFKDTSKM